VELKVEQGMYAYLPHQVTKPFYVAAHHDEIKDYEPKIMN